MITTILSKSLKVTTLLTLIFAVVNVFSQTGPAGIGSSTDNVLWLRSDQGTSTTTDGDPVSGWNDISGNNNHANQPNGVKQPTYIESSINGLPALSFGGTDVNLVVDDNDNLDNTTGVSIFVVGQPDNIDTNPRGLVSKRVNSGSQRAYALFIGYTQTSIYFDSETSRLNGNANAVNNNPQIFSVVFNGSDPNPRSRAFINSSSAGTGNTTNTSIGNMASDLYIGILNDNYGNAFRGDMSEVIVYRRALNFAERSIVEAYLGNRYNITLGSTAYSSTTHTHDFVGIGHVDGDKLSSTENLGSGILLAESNNSLDEDNEFVFAGHDNTAHGIDNSDLPDITPVNLEDRWQRIYYIERVQDGTIDAGSTDIRIGFDFDGTGISPDNSKVYYLLYRAGTSGDFSVVPGGTSTVGDNKVWFSVSDANFATGYYTIAKSDEEVRTFWSFNDGDWSDFNTWSLNADSPLNPGEEIPESMDRVIIQKGNTVTVTQNGTTAGILEVNSGILDFATTTGNSFSIITGQSSGKIKLAADNFPAGDASGFADASSGGTVEYYGSGYDLSNSRLYRNMIINLDANGNAAVLLANYTLNGSLTIERGELHFGNNTAEVARNLTVYEHVEIGVNGKIRTGTAEARHQLNLYGDFTNYGNVQFTNRGAANYTNEADDVVDVNFLSAARNQTMMLEGPTRFYRIEINKGTTSTYEVYMEATDASYFELFGYANQGHPQNEQLTSNTNSFALFYGTVRVGPNIIVPRLNGTGNYNISENAILWVDGGTVTKPSGTAVVVYGKVKVSNGEFNAQINSGITTRLNGVLEVTGGTTNLGQFRTSIYGTQHVGGYIQTGGTVNVNQAWGSSGNYYLFTLSYEGNVFTLTGGTLNIRGANARGAIFINSDPVQQNVTADATINLTSYNTTLFRITSRAPLPTVNMIREGSGNRTFVLEGGVAGTNASNQAVLPALPLVTRGTLTIEDNIVFDPKGQNVTIGGGFSIGSGATYQAASNTTTFAGATSSYDIEIDAAATTKYFHNLTVNNPGQTGTLSGSDITIHNNLTITAGTLAGADRDITVRGNITNSGTITNSTGKVIVTDSGIVSSITIILSGDFTSVPTITIDPPASGTQAEAVALFNGTPSVGNPLPLAGILITNSGSGYTSVPSVTIIPQTVPLTSTTVTINTQHALGGDGTGVFGNLEIDEVHPADLSQEVTYLTAKQTVTGTMTLTNGIFDLKIYNLDVEGTLHSNTIADYSNTRMYRTDGNFGDGGLTRTISANGTYLYPIGTINYDEDAYRYAWANPTFSDVDDEGKVQINGVPRNLPTLGDENPKRYLFYYWRVRHSGFTTNPNVHNQFLSYEDDYTSPFNFNNAVVGKVVDLVRYPTEGEADDEWGTLDNYGGGRRLLNYERDDGDPTPLEVGEFTSAFKPFFNGTIRVFYSRTTAASWYNDWWDNGNNWSFEPHNGSVPDDRATAGDYPSTGDIAIIGYGGHNNRGGYHSVNIRNAIEVGKIEFVPHPSPPEDARISRVVINQAGANNGTLDAGIVEGPGVFQVYNYSTAPGAFPSIIADFSEFNLNDIAVFLFYPSGNTFHIIPNISGGIYPNLRLEGGAATMDYDFIVRNNFTIDSNGDFRTNTGSDGDFQVLGNLQLGDWYGGTLSFNTTGAERTVELGGIRFNLDRHEASPRRIRVINTTPSDLQHRLIVNGDIFRDENDNNRLDLFTDNTGGNNVILELAGEGNHSFTIDGSDASQFNFYKIEVNKGTSQTSSFTFNNAFNIGGLTNGTSQEKSLQLQNGTLYLNHPDINVDLSTGGGDFYIPSTSGLVVQQGEVNVSGNDSGILLDGLLRVETGGTIDMDDAVGNGNNYIEYSASGNATIEVDGGTLTVGSHIRRGTTNPSGVLRYEQTDGTVIIGKNNVPVANRGTFEVLNSGSRFNYTGGTLTVVQPQTAATATSVLIDPSVGTATEATLQLGNADTPAATTISIESTLELGNLSVAGTSTTALLKNRDLIVNGDLTIATDCALTGNDAGNYRSLTVNRHIINNGLANFNVDTLLLKGNSTAPSAAMQEITGDVRVRNLVVEPEMSVTLQNNTDIEIDEDLYLNNGQFIDGGNTITLKGDVYNNASHASSNPNAGGILFNGAVTQYINGSGQFGRLEIDNANQVKLNGSMTLNNHLTLTNGIFHLQQHRLTLGQNANVEGAGFGSGKMIAVYGGAFTPLGMQKNLPTVAGPPPANPDDPDDAAYTNYEFTFPIGSDDGTDQRYLPMELKIANNSGGGSVRVVPVDNLHITFSDPGQEDHVLHQYWEVTSSGIAQLYALQRTHYTQDAVFGAEDEYIGARLYNAQWSKFLESDDPPIVVVDEDNNWINFVHENVNLISGDYTAGEPDWIPDQVPTFFSKQDGDWTDPDTWERNDGGPIPANGPVGQIVHVRTAHTVTVSSNFRRAYQTTINGRLELGSTINHILGYVQGTGTLAIETNSVPTGNYDIFFGCGGGTMEYGGGTYLLSDRYDHYNNLTITGSGTKTLPSVTPNIITICGDLNVLNTVILQSPAGQRIEIAGDFNKAAGASFKPLKSGQRVVFKGSITQQLTGNFIVDNNDFFWNLEVNNSNGLLIDGNIRVGSFLDFKNGIVTSNNPVTVTWNSTGAVAGGSSSSYLVGALNRRLPSSGTNRFPVGSSGRYKLTNFITPSVNAQYWKVEYLDGNLGAGYYDPANYDSPLEMISGSEYWVLNGPNTATATVQFSLTGTSDVAAALGEANKDDLRIVRWNAGTSKWEIVGGGSTVSGSHDSGTITTDNPVTFDGTDQYFTLASVEAILLPTAQFTSSNQSICVNDEATLTVALTGTSPWEITYTDGTDTFIESGIGESPFSFDVSPAVTTTYTLTNVTDAGGGGDGIIYGDDVTITVYLNPDPYNVTSGGNICGATTTTVELDNSDVGFTYELYRDGIFFSSLPGDGGPLTFTGIDQAGTYTVEAYNDNNSNCTTLMAGSAVIEFGSAASAEITSVITPVICENEAVTIQITFTGQPPFTFTLADDHGGLWEDIEADGFAGEPYVFEYTIPDQYPVWNPADPLPKVYIFTITAIVDDAGCGAGTVIGPGGQVDVYKIPETGPQYHIPNTFGE